MAVANQQKSPVPTADLALSLCGEEGIDFGGQHYAADATKAYFTFKFSHAFPVSTIYGTAIHPKVIAKNYKSLKHQILDYEHQVAEYFKGEKDVRDRVIGGIIDVEFPQGPMGGWQVDYSADDAPGITGLAVVWKQTQGMADLLGKHLAGRKKYAVSMEVFYPLEEAGFAVALNGDKPENNFTPPDLLKAGYEYFPFEKAPEELVATFSRKKNRVLAQYKGRKVTVLMGGLDGEIHYAGAGITGNPAERTARIRQLIASAESPLEALADKVAQAFAPLIK